MLRRVAGVCTPGGSHVSSRQIKSSFISIISEFLQNSLNHITPSSMALHARSSFGAFSPSSLFSKKREIIGNGINQNNGFFLHLSGVRLAKMGPSKGRGPLIAKYAPVGFKKGFGAVGLGRHTKKGFFLINSMLIPKLHVPENVGSELKPYVSPETFKIATQKFWEEDSNSLP